MAQRKVNCSKCNREFVQIQFCFGEPKWRDPAVCDFCAAPEPLVVDTPSTPAERQLVDAMNGKALVNRTRIAQLLATQNIFARVTLLELQLKETRDYVTRLKKRFREMEEQMAAEFAKRPVQ